MADSFGDLPVLAALGDEIGRAARVARRPRRRWLAPRVLGVATAIFVPAVAGSAGATLLALRGSVIPVPREVQPEQTPQPQTTRLSGATARDPQAGVPPWTVRLATGRTGLLCSSVGQLRAGAFGIVGLDGRFRTLPPESADSCTVRRSNATSLIGARVFDADRRVDIRTVVSGVAGPTLRRVSVEAGGRKVRVPVAEGGAFVTALRGLPEDLGLRARLRFADGHLETHPLGIAPRVLADPAGGRAWRIQSLALGNGEQCTVVEAARPRRSTPASPPVCGSLGDPRRMRGVFFAVRRITERDSPRGARPRFGAARWRGVGPRMLVWGAAGRDVASIDVRAPGDVRRTGTFFRPSGSFAYMLGPRVRTGSVTVTVRFRDGRTLVRRASTNTISPEEALR